MSAFDLRTAVREHFRLIDRRDTMLGARCEPAWNILLDLAAAKIDGERVSVTSACIAARVPPTTALRCVCLLEDRGLIYREADETDHRRMFLNITDEAFAAVQRLLLGEPMVRAA